ncbi:UNKNOWN [Stylonychia lemnae]|uniref:Transmembrane protein n=1 Tax=Stylonychia lemnae TaxID=5949 RepID=A0A078A3T4_STYLE|nr:UNKNOWN [Stylonychia lemnae]|eukprot:CDW75414.1 UNKNOWN [Stylonychia lemnae]
MVSIPKSITDPQNLLEFIRMKSLQGVYNETFETIYNGGPQCASESTLGFKIALIMILFPYHMYNFYKGIYVMRRICDQRRQIIQHNGRGLQPNFLEIMLGLLCFFFLFFQLHLKYTSNTMIFILNPCHITTALFGLVAFLPYNRFSFMLMLIAFCQTCGAQVIHYDLTYLLIICSWLGIVFAENDELTMFEIVIYYTQHLFAAIVAPMIMFKAGRYSPKDFNVYPLPLLGFIFFSFYMRFFLTPMSAMTWANLNHTLCGVDNDPWRAYFGMHKYFFIWADGYLLLASITFSIFNSYVGQYICRDSLKETKTRTD